MKNEQASKARKNHSICGIIGLCIGWITPLIGVILGIISLSIREKHRAIGILSIVISLFFWVMYFGEYMGFY